MSVFLTNPRYHRVVTAADSAHPGAPGVLSDSLVPSIDAAGYDEVVLLLDFTTSGGTPDADVVLLWWNENTEAWYEAAASETNMAANGKVMVSCPVLGRYAYAYADTLGGTSANLKIQYSLRKTKAGG